MQVDLSMLRITHIRNLYFSIVLPRTMKEYYISRLLDVILLVPQECIIFEA